MLEIITMIPLAIIYLGGIALCILAMLYSVYLEIGAWWKREPQKPINQEWGEGAQRRLLDCRKQQ